VDPLRALRADLARHCAGGARAYEDSEVTITAAVRSSLLERSIWAVAEYRVRQWFSEQPAPLALAWKVVGLVTRTLAEILTGASLPTSARIGPGLHLLHCGPIIVHGGTIAGANLTLQPQITIGAHQGGVPVFGDRVYIGPGARVLGAVRIGDEAVIGANAVVVKDVPAGHIATGVPASTHPGKRPHWLSSEA
jgi:serine O-acetyltransferase